MDGGETLLIGCDILHKEVSYLISKNGWPVRCVPLPSILHSDFEQLGDTLQRALAANRHREKKVFYGTCHPLMHRILAETATVRTRGQNCVEIYLGRELFDRELAAGAFFLFEEWARRWRELAAQCLGDSAVVKDIFAYAHRYLLAVRTPCSVDFEKEALEVASHTGLELRWLDAGLEHLEEVLAETLEVRMRGMT